MIFNMMLFLSWILRNQSMKTYLKLLNRYKTECSEKDYEMVQNNIAQIDKKMIGLSARMFYTVFRLNKWFAWKLFKLLKLS